MSEPEFAVAILAIVVAGIVGVVWAMGHLHRQRTLLHKEYREMTPAERKKFDAAAKKMDEAFKKMNEALDELR